MEPNGDLLQLTRSCYEEETRGRQTVHIYALSNCPAMQPANPSAPPTCLTSSEGSTSTNGLSERDSSRFIWVLLKPVECNTVGAEGCRLITEAHWPRLQFLSLDK
jgi:hypothetical protein